MTVADVLSTTRDILAERGWCQGSLRAADGSVCLVMAINVALSRHMRERIRSDVTSTAVWEAIGQAVGSSGAGDIGRWNDDPSRTYEDVVLALKRAEEVSA